MFCSLGIHNFSDIFPSYDYVKSSKDLLDLYLLKSHMLYDIILTFRNLAFYI